MGSPGRCHGKGQNKALSLLYPLDLESSHPRLPFAVSHPVPVSSQASFTSLHQCRFQWCFPVLWWHNRLAWIFKQSHLIWCNHGLNPASCVPLQIHWYFWMYFDLDNAKASTGSGRCRHKLPLALWLSTHCRNLETSFSHISYEHPACAPTWDQAGEAVVWVCSSAVPRPTLWGFYLWCSSLPNLLQVPRKHQEHPATQCASHLLTLGWWGWEWSRDGTCWCRQGWMPHDSWKATGSLQARMQPGTCRSHLPAAWKTYGWSSCSIAGFFQFAWKITKSWLNSVLVALPFMWTNFGIGMATESRNKWQKLVPS